MKNLLEVFKCILFFIVGCFSKIIGVIYAKPSDITQVEVDKIRLLMKDGDNIHTYLKLSLSNIMRGKWKHSTVVFDGKIYEVTTKGFEIASLEELCFKHHKVILCRPVGEFNRDKAMAFLYPFINGEIKVEYDWWFRFTSALKGFVFLYCSEFVFNFNCSARIGFFESFKKRYIFDELVVYPNDLADQAESLGEWGK